MTALVRFLGVSFPAANIMPSLNWETGSPFSAPAQAASKTGVPLLWRGAAWTGAVGTAGGEFAAAETAGAGGCFFG
jgi:hypothetical protein